MAIPPSAEMARVCSSPEFHAFAERIKRDFQVSIASSVRSNGSGSPSGSPGECSFAFMCQRSNSDFLITARELLEQFLVSQNVPVFPTSKTHKRTDSFAESLPHFDSKLLSAAHGTKSVSFSLPSRRLTSDPTAPDLSTTVVDKRLRMASSSPDVKALFNSNTSISAQQQQTSYLYDIEQQEENAETDSVYDSPAADYWNTTLPMIVSGNCYQMILGCNESHFRVHLPLAT